MKNKNTALTTEHLAITVNNVLDEIQKASNDFALMVARAAIIWEHYRPLESSQESFEKHIQSRLTDPFYCLRKP